MSLTFSDNALVWLQVPSSPSSAILLLARVTPRVQVYFVANVRHVQWAIPQFIQVIGHFAKYHDTLCLSPQILHKHCFQFLLGLTLVPRENKDSAYAKFGGTNKEYYMFRNGLLCFSFVFTWINLTGIFGDCRHGYIYGRSKLRSYFQLQTHRLFVVDLNQTMMMGVHYERGRSANS